VFGEIPMPDKSDISEHGGGNGDGFGGKIIEGAIVEIQDEKGNPSRVLKPTLWGNLRQPPTGNGKYLVITEKEKYKFDRVDINLTGKLLNQLNKSNCLK